MPPEHGCSSSEAGEAAVATLFDVVVQLRSLAKDVRKTRYSPDVLSPVFRYSISRRTRNGEYFMRIIRDDSHILAKNEIMWRVSVEVSGHSSCPT
jgi:hypothetical protein